MVTLILPTNFAIFKWKSEPNQAPIYIAQYRDLSGARCALCRCMLGREISAEGGSPGLVVMGYNSCSTGCMFESRRQIPDRDLDIFQNELLFGNDRKKKKRG